MACVFGQEVNGREAYLLGEWRPTKTKELKENGKRRKREKKAGCLLYARQ